MIDSANSDTPVEPATFSLDPTVPLAVRSDQLPGRLTFQPQPGPTHVLAADEDGKLWQLWACSATGFREWRPLPKLDDAHKQYGGTFAP